MDAVGEGGGQRGDTNGCMKHISPNELEETVQPVKESNTDLGSLEPFKKKQKNSKVDPRSVCTFHLLTKFRQQVQSNYS